MQGGCVLPDNSIIQCTGNNDNNTGKIIHYGQDGTLLNSKTVNYGHANSVTYCDKTQTIFITSTQSDEIGKFKIFEVNPYTLDEINVLPSEITGIIISHTHDDHVNALKIFLNKNKPRVYLTEKM